jgi:3-methyladenine DNA glycosylase AlkD
LVNKIHEYRFTVLLILIEKYDTGNKKEKEAIYNFYLDNLKYINNWDLVDLSAHKIVGRHIYENKLATKILFNLAADNNLWFRRIAVISSFYFIKKGNYELTLKLSEKLLNDKEDLIHKAVGWMLREVGKFSGIEKEEIFLKKYYKRMPRTMLRYSIERFPKDKKEFYMKK